MRQHMYARRIITATIQRPPSSLDIAAAADFNGSNNGVTLGSIHSTVTAMCKEGRLSEALAMLQGLNTQVHPETYASLLESCILTKSLSEGKTLHAHIVMSALEHHEFLGIKLVIMYCRCQSLQDARQVFDKIPHRRPILWNAIIRGYARSGLYSKALALYNQMQDEGIEPDTFTFAVALMACAGLQNLKQGMSIHDLVIRRKLESEIFVGNALVAMYAKCGSIEKACDVFAKMSQTDVVSWNSIIGGYGQHGQEEEALRFFRQMHLAGMKPDSVTVVSVLPACANLEALHSGKEIHGYVTKTGYVSDETVGNAILSMYAKCGSLEDAQQIFDGLSQADVVSWNAMITAYGQNGRCDEALLLFNQMVSAGLKPNVITWCAIIAAYSQNERPDEALKFYGQMLLAGVKPDCVTIASVLRTCAQLESLEQGREIHDLARRKGFESETLVANALVAMYAKCGSMECSRQVFEKMQQRDAVSWSAMIAGYAQRGHGDEALKLFRQMCVAGVKPNSMTITSVLSACARLSALKLGKEIHRYIIKFWLESHVFVGSALIDMYSKCGSIEVARHLFDKMPERNIVSWNAMIAGYAMHGHGEDALFLFHQMQQADIDPDHITFIALLSACSHAGLIDEGWHYFISMSPKYHITPKVGHYSCMVDLLGRAGCLDEAREFIDNMPFEPNADVWGALLGACRIHSNIELGKFVAERLFELQPENPGFYVVMSNIYAAAGRWDDVEKVRTLMKDRGLKRRPGCSWIEVKDKVHAFNVGDKSHPQSEEIYAMLDHLAGQMKKFGYVPDKNFVLHDVEDEEKEHILCYHSEKLAIAFGLISTSPGTPIRIIKNLRVCGDCHSATKLISMIIERQIVVRDANRFHHFKNGVCSCGDYW